MPRKRRLHHGAGGQGGSGGVAGSGSAVTVIDGYSTDCGGCFSQIYTGGDNAGGIIAQSICGQHGKCLA